MELVCKVIKQELPAAVRLDGLDGLRGIAALLVVWHHFVIIYGLQQFHFAGYLAVDFFFMLSGFVMARTYENRLLKGWVPENLLILRLRRLWPVAAVGMLMGMYVLTQRQPDDWMWTAAFNLLFIPVSAPYLFPINNPMWSVFAELVANFLHAKFLYRMRISHLVMLCTALVGLLYMQAVQFGSLDIGWSASNWEGLLPRVMGPYLFGIMLYRTYHDVSPLTMPIWFTVAILPCLLFLNGSVASDFVFLLVLCPLAILGALKWSPPGVLKILGAMSFPIYAIHFPLIEMSRNHWAYLVLIPVIAAALTPTVRICFVSRFLPDVSSLGRKAKTRAVLR